MSEIKHRLNSHDVRTIGKFEAALRKEFDLKVVFRIDHHKEHITNDANLRDICAALEDPHFKNPAQVRQMFAEKVLYMKYPRGTASCGQCPKDMFARPERSQVVVISMPKKKAEPNVPVKEVRKPLMERISPFEREHNLKDILAGLGLGNLPAGDSLGREVGGDFVEKYLTVEITTPTGTGKTHALLRHLSENSDSVLIVPAMMLPSVCAFAYDLGLEDKTFDRITTETKFLKALSDPDGYGAKDDMVVFMQAKVVLGSGLVVAAAPAERRTQFFRCMFDRGDVDQKIILVN